MSESWIHSELSGATLTAVLISDDEIVYTASVGDSHAFLYQFDKIMNEQVANKDESDDENQLG